MDTSELTQRQRNWRCVGIILAFCVFGAARHAASQTLVLPPQDVDVVGAMGTVRAAGEDTLLDIARRHGLGYEEIVRANPGVDPWLPGAGTEIILPTQYVLPPVARKGIVVNLPEMRLYYFPKPKPGEAPVVQTYPVSIGRMEWSTPKGLTQVASKVRDPVWYPPKSIRQEAVQDGRVLPQQVPAGPDNPLGKFALRLGLPGYLIHGTNKPYGVGMQVTHGCVRMYPEDIEVLFKAVPVGTPVRFINQPYKIGWMADILFLEVHTPLEKDEHTATHNLPSVVELLAKVAHQRGIDLQWEKSWQAAEQARGFPVSVSSHMRGAVTETDDEGFETRKAFSLF
jgi:Uncharacterized protein conserved in bacteria